MKNDKDCKIVQELLPNYIDGLTSKEVNEFIEEHINSCSECSKMLEDMRKDLPLKNKVKMKEIDYLKKIKLRSRRIIILSVIIIVLIIGIIVTFLNTVNYIPPKDDGTSDYGKAFINWVTGKDKMRVSKVTNIAFYENGKCTVIITFNENDICLGTRYCLYGENEELKNKYDELKDAEEKTNGNTFFNIELKDGELLFNSSMWTGKTKTEVKESYNKANSSYQEF